MTPKTRGMGEEMLLWLPEAEVCASSKFFVLILCGNCRFMSGVDQLLVHRTR